MKLPDCSPDVRSIQLGTGKASGRYVPPAAKHEPLNVRSAWPKDCEVLASG